LICTGLCARISEGVTEVNINDLIEIERQSGYDELGRFKGVVFAVGWCFVAEITFGCVVGILMGTP